MEVISDINTPITRATEQHTQAADEVNLRINDLTIMTDESLTTSEQLSNASIQLKSSSNNMSEAVSRFKF
jgi:methyl-accepting chemotaxis protein